jgi:hypothetical protein
MISFRELYGVVYVLENPAAQRVKVGMTTNQVSLRLREVNDLWQGRRGSCQVCGGRLNLVQGRIPQHPRNSGGCPGGKAPPLEREVLLAQKYLEGMKERLEGLAGTAKGSANRKIKTLERRIAMPRHHELSRGTWQHRATVFTECAEEVELLSHTILGAHLDETASIGEVFRCSVSVALGAIEAALVQLGLAHQARQELRV